jgi:hypothetical protein
MLLDTSRKMRGGNIDEMKSLVAKAALRRKKTQEGTLDKTIAQIATLEAQINSIESANINRETLAVMEKSSDAIKAIHQGLTPEKVDEIMYVTLEPTCGANLSFGIDELTRA